MVNRQRTGDHEAKDSELASSDAVEEFLSKVVAKPERLAGTNVLASDLCGHAVKHLFDRSKKDEEKPFGVLPELLLEGFDSEQVWEQLHLRNVPLIRYVKKQAKKLISNDEAIVVFVDDGDDSEISGNAQSEDEEEAADTDSREHEDPLKDNSNADEADENFIPVKHGIEDAFLNLDEMNAFLDEQDALEARKGGDEEDDEESDDDIDYFADVPDEEEDENGEQGPGARYDDFYDAPDTDVLTYDDAFNKIGEDRDEELDGDDEEHDEEDGVPPAQKRTRKVRKAASLDDMNEDEELSEGAEDEEDEEEQVDGDEDAGETESKGNAGMSLFDAEDDEDGSLSTFQKQQKALKRKIGNIEDGMLQEKTWAMRGEATRADRPADSLLEPEFEFEHASKPAPVMTTESTGNLEDIIKRRITDQLWDDVERRKETLGADRRTTSLPEVSEEQSKEGLAEVYEKDYREQVMGEEAAPTVISKEEQAIQLDFTHLCYKLDALANFHYAPKPPKEDMEVRANVPAISMEEAIPVGVSDAALLAPEEVYKKHKHLKEGYAGKGEEELTKEDRRARRRSKKKRGMKSSKLNISAKGKEVKAAKARGEPTVIAASQSGESDYSKSSKFFAKLQDEKTNPSSSNKKGRFGDNAPKHSSSNLKL